MAIYTVFEDGSIDPAEAGVSAIFIRDGFSWIAFFLPIPFLLYHRLWSGLLIYLVSIIGIGVLANYLGDTWSGISAISLAILVALEASTLREKSLTKRGWVEAGSYEGSLHKCELTYLCEISGRTPKILDPNINTANYSNPLHQPVTGLFPSPENTT